jgi:hypothetical protein
VKWKGELSEQFILEQGGRHGGALRVQKVHKVSMTHTNKN